MQYPLTIPGFEFHELAVQTSGFWSGPKILIDGKPAPKGPKRGQFLLHRPDGTELVAQLRTANFLDPIPQVVIDGQKYLVAEPLRWYQWIWSGLPILLLFIGGALGGLFGGIALVLNGRVFRTDLNGLAKYLLSGLISIAAAAIFFASAVLFNTTLQGIFPKTAQEFKSEAGGFSVMTPYALTESVQSVDTQAGKIEVHIFAGDGRDSSLFIGYSDYPAALIQASDLVKVLDGSRDGAVANVNGQLVSETKISLNDYPGRDLVIGTNGDNGQEIRLRGRIYLVENRLYQIVVAVPKGKETSREIEDLLGSFKLIGQ